MPAYTGSNPSGTYHTSSGQTVKPSRKGTKVYAPPGVAASKPAGGSVVHTSGAPGAGVTQTIRSTPQGTVYGPTHAPSKGLSRAQVRQQDAKARAAQQVANRRAALVTQAQHNLAKLAKPKIIHQLNKAGTINPHEVKALKAAAPHVVLHYGNRFNPDVVHSVLQSITPKLPNLPQNQKPKTPAGSSKGVRQPPGASKSGVTAKKLVQAGVPKKQARKLASQKKLAPGGQKPKKKARVLPTAAGFSTNAQIFDAVLARKTGRSPEFIGSWMKHEEDPTQPAASPAGPGNQDWLAVGFPGRRTSISQQPAFDNPVTAARATFKYLKGKLPNYQAPSDITNAILGSKTDAQAGAALSQTNYAGAPGVYNPADLMSTISRTKIKLKKGVAAGAGATTKPAKITKKGPLIHPFPQATLSRTDQGKDATGTGPIRAMADAKIIGLNNMNWPNGGAGPAGQNVIYQMTKGPLAGTTHDKVAVAEGITPDSRLKVGSKVKKGQVIGRFYPGSSIEQLFVSSATGAPLTAYAGAADGTPMPAGVAMANLLEGKSIHLGTASGGSFTGSTGAVAGTTGPVSTGASTAPAAASSAPTSKTTARGRQALTPRQRAQQQALALQQRRRRQVLQGAISALGKAPAKAPKVPLTSSSYSTAAKTKAIDTGLA